MTADSQRTADASPRADRPAVAPDIVRLVPGETPLPIGTRPGGR
jgi:hypothetical protein